MNKTLKGILLLGAAAIAATALLVSTTEPAQAALGGLGSPAKIITGGTTGWTNRIAGGSGVTNSTKIDCRGYEYLNIEASFIMGTAGTTNQSVVLYANTSGNTTNRQYLGTLTVAANGTSGASGFTNIALGATAYVYIDSIVNNFATGGTYLTNYAVFYNLR